MGAQKGKRFADAEGAREKCKKLQTGSTIPRRTKRDLIAREVVTSARARASRRLISDNWFDRIKTFSASGVFPSFVFSFPF